MPLAVPLAVPLAALLAALLVGCASIPAPSVAGSTIEGQALFDAAVRAHGGDAFAGLSDVAVAYDGEWYRLVQKLQGVLVDPQYRQRSEERLLLDDGLTGQIHTGPAGEKFVLRERRRLVAGEPSEQSSGTSTVPAVGANGDVQRSVTVRYDGVIDRTEPVRHAAALVVDAYRMFLFGPLHFLGSEARFESLPPVTLQGRLTDRLRVRTVPGLGASAQDDYVLYIDREDRLTRRIRFTLEGLASTRGAVVETDLSDYIERGGMQFPTQFFERIRKPIPRLKAHRWSLTGIDLDRGMTASDLRGGVFAGAAAAPAEPVEVSGG